ncbi:tetratricopeptide repeat protein [Mucilaginibacter ximonensis]|uniref:Tetratricopeptide repeat protein n=1 Tax=Mucilaginibacter ximonensis TaxID=538021 RepID=A0ABW5YH69_9SPHI
MKMISKIASVALGLVFIGSAVFAQSLDDAKKAIDAEQYQKAKGMLKNLTVTQPKSDENLFYLGWVYLIQDYADSAKATFTKGIALEPKSALNYVGLGAVALAANDNAGATSQFNQAISVTGKKDDQPYLYIGKAYLMDAKDGKFPPAKANAAIDALTKAKTINPKDVDVQVTLGNAYRSQLNSNAAYDAYQGALTLDPKSVSANVATGVLWRYAHNYEDSEKQFQAAIAIDPNYGPAYRELAETQKDEAQENIKVASAKIKEAVENYKKYITLTDESLESLLRYADFLVNAGDYTTLQEVATKLSKNANANARVYRYLGYAAYENKDYKAGLDALNSWFTKATPNRILPLDYYYLGRLQVAAGDTTKGIESLKKYADLDTNKVQDAYADIIAIYKAKKDYLNTAKAYDEETSKVHKPLVTDHVYQGIYYYFSFSSKNPDSTLLVKADSALSFAQKAMGDKVPPSIYQYRARVALLKDGDVNNMKGLPLPYYNKIIEYYTANPPTSDRDKKDFAEAYAYLGTYAQYHDKDDAKANENFTKAKELNPDSKQANYYFEQKNGGAASPPKKASK